MYLIHKNIKEYSERGNDSSSWIIICVYSLYMYKAESTNIILHVAINGLLRSTCFCACDGLSFKFRYSLIFILTPTTKTAVSLPSVEFTRIFFINCRIDFTATFASFYFHFTSDGIASNIEQKLNSYNCRSLAYNPQNVHNYI